MGRFYPPIARTLLPISTYIAVTEPLGDHIHQLLPTGAAIYDTRFAFDYYRPLPDTRLLWGGRISIKARDPHSVAKRLRRDMSKVFPSLSRVKIDYAWGGLMGYPTHKMPLLGRTDPRIWHINGFGGHGIAPTTAGGELIAQALLGDDEWMSRWSRYRPRYAGGLIGLLGAQCTYWALQLADGLKAFREGL